MKNLAVSMRIDISPNREEIRDSIDQNLIKFINKAGYKTILISNNIDKNHYASFEENLYLDSWLDSLNIQGIILSGGNDIGQYKIRDNIELNLINYSFKNKMPLLGICRGMQILAKWKGVETIPVKGHVASRLNVQGIINKNVNCFHKYVIARCPEDFKILAVCEEGTIQAISHNKLPWEGWMWHPERESPFELYDIKRFKKIFN